MFSREELFDLVWGEPVTHISRRFKINAVEIRQACKEMNIPLPKMGYWQKIKFGKVSDIEKLPKEYSGITTISFNIIQNKYNAERNEAAVVAEFIVPNKLINPDKLVIAAKLEILKNKFRDKGRAYTHRGYLSVVVSDKFIERALIFMDALIKLLRLKSYNLIVEDGGTYAVIDNEQIKVSIVEKLNRKLVKGTHWNTAEFIPSGILAFRIDGKSYGRNSYEWKDDKEKVEMKLSAILSKLELESIRMKKEREEWRLIRERNERELRLKNEREENRDNELNRFRELYRKSKRYQNVTAIRAYIEAVEESAKSKELKQDIVDWIIWAREKADWYDPMIEKSDDSLKDVDRDTLDVKNRYY